MDHSKMVVAREVLDERVYKFIKTKGPARLMNLVYKLGFKIPKALMTNSFVMDWALRDEQILKRSLQRLRRSGRIWCNKTGTPRWEICEGGE